MYVGGVGMLTPVGANPEMTAAAIRAGINRYSDSNYFTDDIQAIKMSLVPKSALPSLDENQSSFGGLSRWEKHLIQLSLPALEQALSSFSGDAPLPLVLACPEHYIQWPHEFPKQFISTLAKQSGQVIDINASRTIQMGRAGFIEGLAIAQRMLYEQGFEAVIVGAIDSYQRPALLKGLVNQGRIKLNTSLDGFVPGEGAGFLIVTKNTEFAITKNNCAVEIGQAISDQEPGHLYSDEAHTGETLSRITTKTVSQLPGAIDTIYSSMNGENFWSKELGVLLSRNQKCLAKQFNIEHPSDCYGDLGAATGAILTGLATLELLNQEQSKNHLICCSSDYGYRAAVTISLNSIQKSAQPSRQIA